MIKTVPFANFPRAIERSRAELCEAIDRVLARGSFILGEEGASFEEEFARWCGSRHAVGVASGTDAIELALRALGIGPGDDVITQANTCVPTVAAIERAGATAALCDVEPEGGTMNPTSLEAAISARTKAIVPVHLYGQCADMEAIIDIASDEGIPIVEDCAQAPGAGLDGRRAGTMGALGCFSFYPTKNLGALGDAGTVVTDDDELAERLRLLRQYGQAGGYRHVTRGFNSRLDEVQASILRAKLPHLDEANRRRLEIARIYTEALKGTPASPLRLFTRRTHVFHLFVVRVAHRDLFQRALQNHGVDSRVHYPVPIHGHGPYRSLASGVPLRNSEALAEAIVSLPLYPELTDEEVALVTEAARLAGDEIAVAKQA